MESPSRVASVARLAGIAAVVLFALGPLSNQLGVVRPMLGFLAFALGLVLALVAVVLGLVGLVQTRARRRDGRPSARTGLLLGLVVLVGGIAAAAPWKGLPPINDITTDPSDPPVFADAAKPYPGESFAAQQLAAYPDLAPIELSSPPDAAYDAALDAARGLGWEIVREDAAGGVFEATETTAVFRFVDDVVVRVRPDGSGSRVDVRSKSRDGRGDLGANADRIRAFRDRLAGS